MSDSRLPAERPDLSPAFDVRTSSPLVARGLARLSERAALGVPAERGLVVLWAVDHLRQEPWDTVWDTVVEGETVYARTDDGLCALDAASGVQRWCIDVGDSDFRAMDGVVVHFSSINATWTDSQRLCAVDAATGGAMWCIERDRFVFPAAVDGARNRAFVCDAGDVVALDARTGAERWRATVDAEMGAEDSVLLVGDLVLLAEEDGGIFAVEAATGAERWRSSEHLGVSGGTARHRSSRGPAAVR